MEISRTSQKLHFRVTKKDPGLLIRFHVLNLSKSWSNLGFDQDMIQMCRKLKKNQKNEKPKYIVFLCHIVSIFKLINKVWTYSNHTNHVSIPPNPKLCLMKSSMKRSGFGFQRWKFQKPPKNFILE
jgi:hypothetical protein